MKTEVYIKAWHQGQLPKIPCNYYTKQDIGIDVPQSKRSEVNQHSTYTNPLLALTLEYKDIWGFFDKKSISYTPKERDELKREEQDLREQLLRLDYFYIPLGSTEQNKTVTTLLHIYHVFSIPGQEKKKSWVLRELTLQLAKKSETDLYKIFKEYIDQLLTMNSKVTEKDLSIREIHPYYELQLKLCYGEKILKLEKYNQYEKFKVKNVDFVMTMIKDMKTRKEYKTMSKYCIFLLHVLNIDASSNQPVRLWNQKELTCLLSDLLSMLPEGLFYETFIAYLGHRQTMKLSVRFEDLYSCMGRINPHNKLKLILLYCKQLIKHKHYNLYQQFMVQNLKLLIDLKIKVGCNESRRRIVSHDSNNSCDQMNTLWNNEEYRIKKLTSLLSCLLCLLPEDELYGTIRHYLFLIKYMKSDIVPKYLHSAKTDPYLKLLFKLFWWKKLIKEGHADSNIVSRCLNDFCREKCRDNRAEFIARMMSIIDNLSEKSFLKELLQCYLRKNLKTVTSMATTEHGIERGEYDKEVKYAQNMSKQSLIYTQCASIFSGKKMKNVDIKHYLRKLNIKGPEDENEVEMQSEQIKLLMLVILLFVSALGHKSAKLKKYLALKYEYDMASLYLLWCSGDIEVHPGPPWRRKQLEHNSERERKWLQDINGILLKLYWGKPIQSKPKKLWQKENQPEQWPSDKPFYDTKNASKDAKGNKITDDEILTCLLECLKKKEVDIPQIYQSEISAWKNKNIQLLHKLQVYRIEIEKVKSASLNLILSNLEDDAKNLKNIKFSLENSTLDKMQIEGLLNNDLRQKKQAEFVSEITRDLANTLCRLAKGIDPMEKGDGTWRTPPPVDWPEDVPFFNPKNRGKNKDKPKCRDTVLVCTFLKLQHLRIPENLKQIVNAYQTVYNCTDTDGKKKNKEKLCRLYVIQSNLEKLDCSLQNLHKEGLFLREVHGILNQWWNTQSVDEHAELVLKSANVRSDERPYIAIDITKNFEQDTDLRYTSYSIPLKDAYLHIKCTKIHSDQSSHEQTITGPLVPANSSENIEDSALPPDVTDFVLEHDFVDPKHSPYNNSVMYTDNRHTSFDLQRQVNTLHDLPVTHQHLKPHNDLDTLATHNTLDLNGGICTTKHDTTSLQTCNSGYRSNDRTGENLGGNMGTSKVKRKQIDDQEEPVKKLLKLKVNQCEHYDRIDEDLSTAESKRNGLSLELIPNSLREICSDKVLDLWSLYLHENIDEVKNNDNQNDQIEGDEELESFSDLDNFISGKPSQMETNLL